MDDRRMLAVDIGETGIKPALLDVSGVAHLDDCAACKIARKENVVRLFGTANPRFFEGTRVAAQAAAVLHAAPARAAAE